MFVSIVEDKQDGQKFEPGTTTIINTDSIAFLNIDEGKVFLMGREEYILLDADEMKALLAFLCPATLMDRA